MWAALTALFVVVLIGVVGWTVWFAANVISFLQPILIPVAIAAILAYLLDPVVAYLSRRGLSRVKAISLLFLVAFVAIARFARVACSGGLDAGSERGKGIAGIHATRARRRGRSHLQVTIALSEWSEFLEESLPPLRVLLIGPSALPRSQHQL